MRKFCKQCQTKKPLTDFRVRKSGKVEKSCRECERGYAARYRFKNRALCNMRTACWLEANRDALNASRRKRYAKNPEFFRRVARNWQIKNPEKAYQTAVNWQRGKSESAFRFRLVTGLRNRINKILNGHNKSASTLALLGCSIQEFRAYLESQFSERPGMSWENRELWHIDHIIPCAKFHLQHSEEQEICFHYTNLQPLWAVENLQKGDKL